MKRKRTPKIDILDSPRADTTDESKIARRRKFVIAYVWASVVLVPLAALSVLTVLGNKASSTDTPAAVIAGEGSQSRSVAAAALQRWISESKQFKGSTIVSWIDTSQIESPAPSPGKPSPPSVSTHRFAVVTPSGEQLEAGVQVAELDDGPVVVSAPSVMPVAELTDPGSNSTSWPGAPVVAVSSQVSKAAQFWADAFFSGDPDEIRQAIGDPNAKRLYVPFNAAKGTTPKVSVTSAARRPDGGYVVRATVSINDTKGSTVDKFDLDLVVSDPTTAAPKVVAWTAPGNGLVAKRYSNSVSFDPTHTVRRQIRPTTTTTTTTVKKAG